MLTSREEALTVVGHAHRQALLKATVLALVPVLLLDLTAAFTLVVLQFKANGPAEETLREEHKQSMTHITQTKYIF